MSNLYECKAEGLPTDTLMDMAPNAAARIYARAYELRGGRIVHVRSLNGMWFGYKVMGPGGSVRPIGRVAT